MKRIKKIWVGKRIRNHDSKDSKTKKRVGQRGGNFKSRKQNKSYDVTN